MQIVCQKYKFTPLQRLCNAQKKAKYLSLRTGKAGQEEEEEEEREERNKRNDERGGAYAGSRAKKGQKQMGYGVWGMGYGVWGMGYGV